MEINKEEGIALSTLKLNVRVLRDLGLVRFGDSKPIILTKAGEEVVKVLGGGENES